MLLPWKLQWLLLINWISKLPELSSRRCTYCTHHTCTAYLPAGSTTPMPCIRKKLQKVVCPHCPSCNWSLQQSVPCCHSNYCRGWGQFQCKQGTGHDKVDQYFTTMSTGEELLISEGSCCGAAVVCSVQAEPILGGGARVSAPLTLKGEGGGRRLVGRTLVSQSNLSSVLVPNLTVIVLCYSSFLSSIKIWRYVWILVY